MQSLRQLCSSAGLAVVVMAFAFGCGDDASSPAAPSPGPGTPSAGGSPPDVTITILSMSGAQSYSPNPGTVRAGQTVAWRNGDSVTHTATADGGAFNTGSIAPGATSTAIRMPTAGSLAYHCSLHPSMVGTLQVQ